MAALCGHSSVVEHQLPKLRVAGSSPVARLCSLGRISFPGEPKNLAGATDDIEIRCAICRPFARFVAGARGGL